MAKTFASALAETVIITLLLAPRVAAQPNTPPRLAANQAVVVLPGQTVVIDSAHLRTVDDETTDPVEIIYTLFPDDPKAVFPSGGLYLGNRLLKGGDWFSQEDIDRGLLAWRAPSPVTEPSMGIPFNVQDYDGALARDGSHTVFSLGILYSNTPPEALGLDWRCPLGGRTNGVLRARSLESYQALTFQLVSQPAKGVAALDDPRTGAFTYTARAGQAGWDAFTFQVSDGQAPSLQAGTVRILITNHPPVIPAQRFELEENGALTGAHRIAVQDPDLPAQALTFSVLIPPSRGRLTAFERDTGRFEYLPDAGRFGLDQFVVSVSDGQFESAYQAVQLAIRGDLNGDNILIAGREPGPDPLSSDDDIHGIYLINPLNGDTSRLFQGDHLKNTLALVYDKRRGQLLFAGSLDATGGGQGNPFIGAIDTATGAPRIVASGASLLSFPIGLAIDRNQRLLISDGPGGVKRMDLDAGRLETLSQGGLLQMVSYVFEGLDGSLLVLDMVDLFGDAARVVRLDPQTGQQILLTDSSQLLDPFDLLELDDGRLLVLSRGGLFQLDSKTGGLAQILRGNAFASIPKEFTLDKEGQLVIVEMEKELLRVNLATTNLAAIHTDIQFLPYALADCLMPATLAGWRGDYFTAEDLASPAREAAIWGGLADPDGDGQPNCLEFALGLNPMRPDRQRAFTVLPAVDSRGQQLLKLSFQRRRSVEAARVAPQISADLRQWEDLGFVRVETDTRGEFFDKWDYYYQYPPAGAARFFRLKLLL